jgi:copper(I)-binding protein
MNLMTRLSAAAMMCGVLATSAWAQTTVAEPWVRAAQAPQKATGAFMHITSATGAKLVAASSPVANIVEIHEMKMDGDVMRMAPIASLDLPAGKPVVLRPGSYHIMLIDLKQPLKAGDSVPLTLSIEGADKKKETVNVQATVKAMGMASGASGPQHGHHGM